MADAAARLREAQRRIATAAEAAGRVPAGVTLIAVTKTLESAAIQPVLRARHRNFGENRVQEAARKWPALRDRYPDIRLHLIGPLQTNKARDAVSLFDAIHSVDRDKLAAALAGEMDRQGRRLPVFVQVNTGGEAQKSGVAPQEAADLVRRCREAHGLQVEGLMCLPPAEADPAPHFALLRRLGGELGLEMLSMGMSGDFETAIAQGATHVRVGSAIFGERQIGYLGQAHT